MDRGKYLIFADFSWITIWRSNPIFITTIDFVLLETKYVSVPMRAKQLFQNSEDNSPIANSFSGSTRNNLVRLFPVSRFRSDQNSDGAADQSKMDPGKSQQRTFSGLK
jgi:hypothetical protein